MGLMTYADPSVGWLMGSEVRAAPDLWDGEMLVEVITATYSFSKCAHSLSRLRTSSVTDPFPFCLMGLRIEAVVCQRVRGEQVPRGRLGTPPPALPQTSLALGHLQNDIV